MRTILRIISTLLVVLAFATPAIGQDAAGEKLVIRTAQGEFPFTVEIADDPAEQAKGLMFRETMEATHGMLFDFGEKRPVTMWMKNTPMPLDMVFVRADGTVAGIAERTTPFSEDVIASPEPVTHVLEIRAGVARLIGLKAGDRLEHPIFGR